MLAHRAAIRHFTTSLPRCNTARPPPSYFTHDSGHHAAQTPSSGPGNRSRSLTDIAMVIAVGTLCFLAIDNYRARCELQAQVEQDRIKLAETQEFLTRQTNAARKKRELQILNERKTTKMREMKLALHVAMLRAQLQDHGIEPRSIDDCVHEYARSVKMDNSISNVSGTALWINDDNSLKGLIPSPKEYEERGR
ncbi:hypothetical protein HG536_0A08520 [Torulaspora globosa]|uniref:Uncharacterized protein n=1 Tax=Torulaspora globosa TaxID=48254 RepID=A0A7G3ZC01_9SACH|nr:uncharacterized protein HG536_0A08520 [Torulaspora globosa]QLL31037.1 hypothetical protein HG536_0A08520 [Torulaspora globosa]